MQRTYPPGYGLKYTHGGPRQHGLRIPLSVLLGSTYLYGEHRLKVPLTQHIDKSQVGTVQHPIPSMDKRLQKVVDKYEGVSRSCFMQCTTQYTDWLCSKHSAGRLNGQSERLP